MHDLNMIIELNRRAVEEATSAEPTARTYVMEKAGLHVVRTDVFDSQEEALAYVERRRAKLPLDASLHIV